MGTNSKIEWTDHTFNPWRGCSKVAAGCDNCYADRQATRNPKVLGIWGPQGTRVRASNEHWRLPVKWNREAEAAGVRARVFCASLADVFEDWHGPIVVNVGGDLVNLGTDGRASRGPDDRLTMNDLRRDLFALIDATPWLDWILLTKRPENVRRMLVPHCLDEVPGHVRQNEGDGTRLRRRENVWLLTSIANQEDADRNLPELLKCRDLAAVLGVSAEPLIGPADLSPWMFSTDGFVSTPDRGPVHRDDGGNALDWVIVGGESGPHARPMHPVWARSIRDQCQASGVPFFFKQWGEWCEGIVSPYASARNPAAILYRTGLFANRDQDFTPEVSRLMRLEQDPIFITRIGKKAAGRLLDGRTWDELPVGAESRNPNA